MTPAGGLFAGQGYSCLCGAREASLPPRPLQGPLTKPSNPLTSPGPHDTLRPKLNYLAGIEGEQAVIKKHIPWRFIQIIVFLRRCRYQW